MLLPGWLTLESRKQREKGYGRLTEAKLLHPWRWGSHGNWTDQFVDDRAGGFLKRQGYCDTRFAPVLWVTTPMHLSTPNQPQ